MNIEIKDAIYGVIIAGIAATMGYAGDAHIERKAREQVNIGIQEWQESEIIRHLNYYNTKESLGVQLTPDDKANKKAYQLQLDQLRNNQ